ncbi:MAG: hypothetical protein AB7E24_05335 [Novosphingobium sp.]
MGGFLKRTVILVVMFATFAGGLVGTPASAGSWGVEAPQGSDWAEASAQGQNHNTWLLAKCSSDRASIGLTLRDFWGTALGRVNGERYPVLITFAGAGGLHADYYVGLRYDTGEKEWSTDGYDIPRSFLDAFAKGATMRFDAAATAEEIATYQLKGSAAAARKMREACWERSGG